MEKNPEGLRRLLRNHRLRRAYGITLDQFLDMVKSQNGRCLICMVEMTVSARGRDKRDKLACVDHDHESGKIRGVLCNNCNRGLGLFGENLERLSQAMRYLESHK